MPAVLCNRHRYAFAPDRDLTDPPSIDLMYIKHRRSAAPIVISQDV